MGSYYSFLEHESQEHEPLFLGTLTWAIKSEPVQIDGHEFQKLAPEDSSEGSESEDDTFVELSEEDEEADFDEDDQESEPELEYLLAVPGSLSRKPSNEVVLSVLRYYLNNEPVDPLLDTPTPMEVASVLNHYLMDPIEDLYRKILDYQEYQEQQLGDSEDAIDE